MESAAEYLRVPTDYLAWWALCVGKTSGHLHWSANAEAVEYADDETFALSPEIGLFIEGMTSSGRLWHFAYVLHFMYLFQPRRPSVSDDLAILAHSFAKTGRRLRNAGLLAAVLCERVPALDNPPDFQSLIRLLSSPALMSEMCASWSLLRRRPVGDRPPLPSYEFENKLRQALKGCSPQDLEHWLKHGCAPIHQAGKKMAATMHVEERRVGELLSSVMKRPRLAGAARFVPQMVSALSLLPRVLRPQQLPLGGYADLATRGHPEQIIPSQFALEGWEFLRRFAERELLYFRREEPPLQTKEDLVILLDQGVRTWGIVRLVLTSAAIALGKYALRREVAFSMATTSTGGTMLDLQKIDESTLGQAVEASDFSFNPGAALETALDSPAQPLRDVVLLTHPRALHDSDVIAASRRVSDGTRLFALAVEDTGRVLLAELRHGSPVPIFRFQVDLSAGIVTAQREQSSNLVATHGWKGHVEPIGFPFPLGIRGRIQHFDFDAQHQWLIVAAENGMLHAFKTDSSASETLPRPMIDGHLLKDFECLRGVSTGFVVAGRLDDVLWIFHYKLAQRSVSCHQLGKLPARGEWHYFDGLHCVAYAAGEVVRAVDLNTGQQESRLPRKSEPEALRFRLGSMLHLNRETGELTVSRPGAVSGHRFTAKADGRPILANHEIVSAQLGNEILALIARPLQHPEQPALRVFDISEPKPLFEVQLRNKSSRYSLSADGRLLAVQSGPNRLEVRDVQTGGGVVVAMPWGKTHNRMEVEVGHRGIVTRVGRFCHSFSWPDGQFSWSRPPTWSRTFQRIVHNVVLAVARSNRTLPERVNYDPKRFVTCLSGPVDVVIDSHGHLLVFDRSGELICTLFVFRRQAAGWMPDGTRFGSFSLIGGAETPHAYAKFGRALQEAWSRGTREVCT
jgi:hypothetical protein